MTTSFSLLPFGTRRGLFEEFNREMNTAMQQYLSDSADGNEQGWHVPAVNVAETENAYEVTLDVPGMKIEDFDVELNRGELWITGERKQEHEEQGKKWHRVERRYGKFRRAVTLGNDIEPSGTDAEYKDGVLHIKVAKSPNAQPKRIEIRSLTAHDSE